MEGEQKIDIDKLINELKKLVKVQKVTEIIKALDCLLEASSNFSEDDIELEIDSVFLILLTHQSTEIVAKTAKTIAEIAKSEKGRIKFTDGILIKTLVNLLKINDVNILTQTSRALGNICYENEQGKKMVQEVEGLKHILNVIKRALELKQGESTETLKNMSVGFLVNYLADQQNLKQKAVDEEIIPIICTVLEVDGKAGKKSATHALLTLEILNEAGIEFLNEKLIKILADILASDASTELSELSLELLHSQAENDKIQILLAKSGVCKVLVDLLEKHVGKCQDEEAKALLKIACNLIVIILTGDESMNLLYSDSKGIVYKKMISWLEDNYDDDLKVTAVLAMGNFARTDAHCQLMVIQDVHKLLLKLLENNNSNNGDIRLQHALLSAIRNLVIPVKNKSILLADGLVDIVYPMLEIETFPVVFKLLGTLRIVIDGQEEAAKLLGTKDNLIKKSIEWCKTEDHAGVQGEANRLLAWLVINSKSCNVISLMIKLGAIEHLVKMVTSLYSLMQNEALMSLAIITAVNLTDCQDEFIKIDIAAVLIKFFQNSADKFEAPIVENAITFSTNITKSDTLREHLKKSKLSNALSDLTNSLIESSALREKINVLCNLIQDRKREVIEKSSEIILAP